MSGATEALVCTHCEVTFRLAAPLADAHYRCIRCRKSVGPAASAKAATRWLFSGEAFSGGSTYTPGQTWGEPADEVALPMVESVGKYDIVEELGRGGMGVVYQAYDADSDRYVALKLLLAGSFAHHTQVQRFLREARAAAELSHEAIVPVYDIGNFEGQLFFAMAYVEGVTLRAVLDSAGALPVREACRIAATMARGLAAAHEGGFAHRDVKPANILIEAGGRAYLTDFGLVIEADSSRLTQTGTVMGTPTYMAPELARGEKDPNWSLVDVYALGSVFYEMVTGKRAYGGEAGMQVLLDILADPPTPAGTLVPELARDVEVILQRAMARDPQYRYQSAADLADDLERYVHGEAIAARPLSASYRAFQFGKRYQGPILAICATVALTVIGTAAIWTAQTSSQREADALREEVAQERLTSMNTRVDDLLSHGRIEEADRTFLTFTSADAHIGTAAVGKAWLRQAERNREAGKTEGELTALGTAYTSTSDAALQDRTLLEIARAFRERWWWDRMNAALELISIDDAAAAAEVLTLRVETAAALGNLDGALELLESADAAGVGSSVFRAMVASLARGTPLGREARSADTLDLDGDGIEEIVVFPKRWGEPLVAYSANLSEVRRWEFTADNAPGMLHVLDRTSGLFAGSREGKVSAYHWTEDGFETVGAWEDSGALACVAAIDTDGDGNRNLYMGFGPYTRHLAEANLEGGELASAHPPTDLAMSDISALTGLDLTGDGRDELVVAVGPWSAWDLRVLTHDGDGLKRIARTKLGYVGDLRPMTVGDETLLLAAKSDVYPSIQAFPTDAPYGRPAGLYLFAWSDDGLVERQFLPAPAPMGTSMRLNRPVVADLDGDGLEDIAVTGNGPDATYILLYRQNQDGNFDTLAIGGLRTLAAVGSQLLVADTRKSREFGEIWLLGRGDTFPEAQATYVGSAQPAPDVPPAELGTWERAERLVEMGLNRQAAAAFEDLGNLVAGTDLAGQAWFRAGSLREETNDPDAALRAYEEAGAHPIVSAKATLAGAKLLFAENRFEASRDLADRIRSDSNPDIAASVEELWPADRAEAATIVTTLAFDRPLSDAWVVDPVAVRRDAIAGTLVVDAVTGHGTLARLPLERVGPMALSVDFELARLEWAAGVRIVLRPIDGPAGSAMGIGVAGWGGGGLLERQIGCMPTGQSRIGGQRTSVPGAADPIKLHGELRSSYAQDAMSCRITGSEGGNLHSSSTSVKVEQPPGRWELAIESSGDEATNAAMLAQIAISNIEIRGAVLATSATVASDNPIATAMSTDVTTSRKELLESDPEALVRALRSRRETFVPIAQAALGRDYFQAYASAWLTAANMHDHDEAVQRSLLADLDGLRALAPRSQVEASVRHELLYFRGRARWRAGQARGAADDLLAIVADSPRPGSDDRSMAELLFNCHRLLASIALSSRDEGLAIEHAESALSFARSREIGVDRLLLDPQLGPMREAAGWEAVFGD